MGDEPDADIDRIAFRALVDRAGLTLTAAQFETMRRSYEHVRALAELVRMPRDRRVEAVHVFVSPAPGS